MTILKPRAQWLLVGVFALLAFAAVLAFHPGATSAQTADPESDCLEVNSIPAATPEGAKREPQTRIYPDQVKKPDLAMTDLNPANGPKRDAIFRKNATVTVVNIQSVQDAIDAINAAYNANTPRRKLNVVIGGHGSPGLQSIGKEAIGHTISKEFPDLAENEANQEKFINGNGLPGKAGEGAKNKIQHLTLLGCRVGQDKGFLQKLKVDLGASLVTAATERVWPRVPGDVPGNLKNGFYLEDDKGGRLNVVGGIVVDPDTGALTLQSDASSSGDAWLLTGIAIVTASAFALGGGAWYVRRRRMR